MKRHARALRVFLSFAVLVYFTAAMIYSTAHAQTASDFRMQELERRASVIEQERLGERIAKVEAVLETNNKLLVAVLIAIAGMALERIAQLGKARKPEETD